MRTYRHLIVHGSWTQTLYTISYFALSDNRQSDMIFSMYLYKQCLNKRHTWYITVVETIKKIIVFDLHNVHHNIVYMPLL